MRETSAGGLVVRGLDRCLVAADVPGTAGNAADGPGTPDNAATPSNPDSPNPASRNHDGAATRVDFDRIDVALIGRLDRRGRMLWSMPKGHVEPGETMAETARREVIEETGLNGTILSELGSIDYWFVADDRRIHKTVHHHLIRFDDGELCDEDPEITEVAWVPFETLHERLAYPDERKLVRAARDMLKRFAEAEAEGRNPPPAPPVPVDPSRRSGRDREAGESRS